MTKRGVLSPGLREQLADEAARLIRDHGIQDYGLAKRKAAERFGVTSAGALPSNAEVEACVLERQRLFDDGDIERLAELRGLAIELMELLDDFQPRLAGPVLTGAMSARAHLELHLFTDSAEEVIMVLQEHGVRFRNCQRRYRYNGGNDVIVPGFRCIVQGEHVFAMTFPEKGLRQAPMSPIDGRPMRRADRRKVRALIDAA
jgi:hypothetical protein